MPNKGDAIIVFRHYDNAIDANIAKTKLDAYGIPCFLTEENMANLYPGQSLYAFKIRLHLFEPDREKAEEILIQHNLTIDGENAPTCPNCQSHNIIREFPKRLSESLTYVLFGVFFPHKKVNHCLQCDHEF